MNLIKSSTPNKWDGGNTCKAIIIHWWDDPAKKPSLEGVVRVFQNPAYEVAAHYIVSGDTVVKMCNETDRPWHAVAANGFGIGIEVDPNTPGNTYKTVGELVRDIRSRHGNIPIRKHSDYVNTRCPGALDIARIEREAAGQVLGNNTEGGDMPSRADINISRILLHRILGLDGFGVGAQRPNAINKETEKIAQSYVGRETNDLIWEFWNSEQGQSYYNKEIPEVYRLANKAVSMQKELEALKAAGTIDSKGSVLLQAIKEYVKG